VRDVETTTGSRFAAWRIVALTVMAIALMGGASSAQQMSLQGNFAVNSNGAATYDVAIAVPPGTAGMVPSLKLSCSSQNGNGNTNAPYQVSVSRTFAESWDLDGSAIPTSTTTYQYDSYGNPTQIVTSTPDGFSKTTTNTYTNNTTAPNWLLGRLTNATVTSTTPLTPPPP
jgi:hypothetical protein